MAGITGDFCTGDSLVQSWNWEAISMVVADEGDGACYIAKVK